MIYSLVGCMAVAHHLGQDPLLVSLQRFHPCSHFVPGFGHVIPGCRHGPAQGGRPGGEQRSASKCLSKKNPKSPKFHPKITKKSGIFLSKNRFFCVKIGNFLTKIVTFYPQNFLVLTPKSSIFTPRI